MMNKPNILFIHSDQHRADCFGHAGRKGLFTPNLDYLATSGIRFSSAYATCPVCIPQRLTLLTGQLASRHGVLTNAGIPDFPLEKALPALLQANGYQTALVGRGFHTYPSDNPIGFEHYEPGDPSSELKESNDCFFRYLRDQTGLGSDGYYANGTSNNSLIGNPFHLSPDLHHTQWVTDRTLRFLDSRDQHRPFFLSVGYYAPHGPHNPPAEYFNRYYYSDRHYDQPSIGDWEIPPVANWNPNSGSYVNLDGELLRNTRAGYYGNITFIDFQIGRILNKLIQMRNTYIIFSSDHGEMLGDHYFAHKSKPYQGAAHIPLFIAGPAVEPAQVCDKPVGWHDLFPTICDLAKIDCPNDLDGMSLSPLLHATDDKLWREWLHGENPGDQFARWTVPQLPGQIVKNNLAYEKGWHFITDGHIKYIWYTQSGREQFFNLDEDPGERHDLAQSESVAEILQSCRERLIKVLAERPEGFSDGHSLKAGCDYPGLMPAAEQLARQRVEDGGRIAYYILTPILPLCGSTKMY